MSKDAKSVNATARLKALMLAALAVSFLASQAVRVTGYHTIAEVVWAGSVFVTAVLALCVLLARLGEREGSHDR
jgi:hypothetical protein